MNFRNFYCIKNWAAIAWGENGRSENEFLGKSDSDDEYVYCKSSYNNPKSEESIQIIEKKESAANCLGTQAKPTFLHKMRNVSLPEKNENCFKTFHKS